MATGTRSESRSDRDDLAAGRSPAAPRVPGWLRTILLLERAAAAATRLIMAVR